MRIQWCDVSPTPTSRKFVSPISIQRVTFGTSDTSWHGEIDLMTDLKPTPCHDRPHDWPHDWPHHWPHDQTPLIELIIDKWLTMLLTSWLTPWPTVWPTSWSTPWLTQRLTPNWHHNWPCDHPHHWPNDCLHDWPKLWCQGIFTLVRCLYYRNWLGGPSPYYVGLVVKDKELIQCNPYLLSRGDMGHR